MNLAFQGHVKARDLRSMHFMITYIYPRKGKFGLYY